MNLKVSQMTLAPIAPMVQTQQPQQQPIDKDKIEKSIRKMRAYQKFLKVFNSTTSNHKKDINQDHVVEINRKKSDGNLKRSNTRKDSQKNLNKAKKMMFHDKGKINSEVVAYKKRMAQIKLMNSKQIIKFKTLTKKIKQESEEEEFIDFTESLGDLNLKMIEQKRKISRFFRVIQPEQTFKTVWDLTGMIIIVYLGIMIPYRLSFGDVAQGPLEILEYLMDCYFIIDIGITFNTGYYKHGNLIINRRSIMINYFKTWFVVDALASFPYTWILDNIDTSDQTASDYSSTNFKAPQLIRLIRIIRFIRLLKLLRILKLKSLLYKFEEFFLNDRISLTLDFTKLFVITYFIIHWLGCFFFAIGSYEDGFGSDSWLQLAKLDQTNDYYVQYITSIYWAFLTMATIGYGDIYPVTVLEKCYVIVCMIVACALFAYIVGYIGSTLERSDTIIQEFKTAVKRYLDYIVDYKRQFKLEEEEVLDMLSEGLRLELIVHLNGKMLHNTPIFKNFNIQFLSEVTFVLRKETLSDDYKLFDEGDQGTTLYFITRGSIILAHKETHTYIKELGVDDFLGEVAFFSDLTRTVTARCKNMTEVLILDQKDFMTQATVYPTVVNTFLQMKNQINEENDLTGLGIICYLCESYGHVAVDCAMFNIIKGNLKKHAIEKLKKVQKILTTQHTKRRIRRARSRLNFEQNDSIETDEDFNDNSFGIGQIREATNEDDSEQLEEDENPSLSNPSSMQSQEKQDESFENEINIDQNEDEDLTFVQKSAEKDKSQSKIALKTEISQAYERQGSQIERQDSISSAKHLIRENHEKSKKAFVKRNSIMKSLTFKDKNVKFHSPPLRVKLDIHDIEEEKSESDSSSYYNPNRNQKTKKLDGLHPRKDSIKHAVTMKELTQIISKVKQSSKLNEKVQKNSMIAKGIKFALKEINKEIRRKSQMIQPSTLVHTFNLKKLDSQQSNEQKPSAPILFKSALQKKLQLLQAHNSVQSQEIQSSNSSSIMDSETLSKINSYNKLTTFKGELNNNNNSKPPSVETPKMRKVSLFVGGGNQFQSMFQHAFSTKFKAELASKSNSSPQRENEQFNHYTTNSNFSKLALPKQRSTYSNQGTFRDMENLNFSKNSSLAKDSSLNQFSKNLHQLQQKSKLISPPNLRERDSISKRFKSQQTNFAPLHHLSQGNFQNLHNQQTQLKQIPTKEQREQSKESKIVHQRRKSIFINGAVPIPDDLNFSLLEDLVGNISMNDSFQSSMTSSEDESDDYSEEEFKEIQSVKKNQLQIQRKKS